ncbi:MAG: hypothetical protein RSC08_05885 [Oscillospiraceae bacterium]
MEVIRVLRSRRGEIALRSGFILLAGALMLVVLLQGIAVYTTIDNVMKKTGEAVLAVATTNGENAFGGIRESAGTARTYDGYAWDRLVTTTDVERVLQRNLKLTRNGSQLTHQSGGKVAYHIQELRTYYLNSDHDKLNFVTTLVVKIPVAIGGDVLPPIAKRLEVKTTYEAKF